MVSAPIPVNARQLVISSTANNANTAQVKKAVRTRMIVGNHANMTA